MGHPSTFRPGQLLTPPGLGKGFKTTKWSLVWYRILWKHLAVQVHRTWRYRRRRQGDRICTIRWSTYSWFTAIEAIAAGRRRVARCTTLIVIVTIACTNQNDSSQPSPTFDESIEWVERSAWSILSESGKNRLWSWIKAILILTLLTNDPGSCMFFVGRLRFRDGRPIQV